MPKAAIMPVTVPSSPRKRRERDDRVEHRQVGAQSAHLGLGGRFHGGRGRSLPLAQARRDHARGRGVRAAHDLERLVQLAALGELERVLGGADVALPPPEAEALDHHGQGHHRADHQRDHHGPALGERLDQRADVKHDGSLAAG